MEPSTSQALQNETHSLTEATLPTASERDPLPPSKTADRLCRAALSAAKNREWKSLALIFSLLGSFELLAGRPTVVYTLDVRDKASGLSLLHWLVHNQAPAHLITCACKLGADLHAKGAIKSKREGLLQDWTPLHLAANGHNRVAIQALLAQGADPMALDSSGQTPLIVLCRSERDPIDLEALKLFIDRPDVVGHLDGKGRSALSLSLRKRDWQAVKELTTRGATLAGISQVERNHITRSQQSHLITLSRSQHLDPLSSFLDKLKLHAEILGEATVRSILNVRLDHSLFTLLHRLCDVGAPLPLIRKLVSLGADMALGAPLHNYDFMRPGEDPVNDTTALHLAAIRMNLPLCELLLTLGTEPDQKDGVGDTPLLAMMRESSAKQSAIPLIELLMRHGADPTITNTEGLSVLARSLKNRQWNDVEYVLKIPGIQESVASAVREEFAQYLGDDLGNACFNGDWKEVVALLRMVIRVRPLLGAALTNQIVNTPYSVENDEGHTSTTPLHWIAFNNSAAVPIIKTIIRLGGDLNAMAEGFEPDNGASTPLTVALTRKNETLATLFLLQGATLPDALISKTATLARFFLFAEPWAKTPKERLAQIRHRLHTLFSFMDGLQEFGPLPKSEAMKFIALGQSVEHAELYLRAFGDAVKRHRKNLGTHFTRLLPHLLFRYPPGSVSALVRSIESTMDRSPSERGYHQNEAEMMMLLNHPKDPHKQNLSALGTLTTSLTSISRHRGNVSGLMADNWGSMGNLTFSFPRWKYEAMRQTRELVDGTREVVGPSLLERYGFVAAAPRPTDWMPPRDGKREHYYGPGFVLKPGSRQFDFWLDSYDGHRERLSFDQKTYVEFRRAYLLISHPAYGTLLIRNSSPQFGRDRLQHPAYWSDKGIGAGFSEQDLFNLNELTIQNHFTSILASELYEGMYRDREPSRTFLRRQLVSLKEDIAAWKFDTSSETAWKDSQLVGGHLSPGFQHVVNFLIETYNRAQRQPKDAATRVVVPDLAFVDPNYPPWSPYEWVTHDGTIRNRLKATRQVLQTLKMLSLGIASDDELEGTDVRDFLQQAGFDTRGELLLLDPE